MSNLQDYQEMMVQQIAANLAQLEIRRPALHGTEAVMTEPITLCMLHNRVIVSAMKLLTLAVLLLAASAWSQEVKHTTTVEQCRVDQRLWLSKIGDQTGPLGIKSVSYHDLRAWANEMDSCQTVDPENSHRYYNTWAEIQSAFGIRFLHFLERHNLLEQFLGEDAAGQR